VSFRHEKGEFVVKLVRRLGVLSATTLLATGLAVAISPAPAQSHGVTMFPGSRTYNCWVDGLTQSGAIQPNNPACAAAVQSTGTTPLYNWFAVLNSNADGRNVGFIPDGQICSGGSGNPFDFSAYNAARSDFPITHLTSGRTITIRHSNWARHPSAAPRGAFRTYITRQGWSPNTPLRWGDMDQIQSVSNPPENIPQAGSNNYYFWDLPLPSGRSGRAMLFIQWVRSDSAENFFSCSDIVFDGGNGEVTGIGPNQTIPPITNTPPQTTTTRPGTTTTTQPGTSTSTQQPTGSCTATFSVTGTPWNTGFQGGFTVRAGTAAINGWTVRWTNPAGQSVSQVWSGTHTPNGSNSTVANASYNGSLGANATTSFGFLASRSGTATPSVSNVTCSSP
jgi:chitin-binding protein